MSGKAKGQAEGTPHFVLRSKAETPDDGCWVELCPRTLLTNRNAAATFFAQVAKFPERHTWTPTVAKQANNEIIEQWFLCPH